MPVYKQDPWYEYDVRNASDQDIREILVDAFLWELEGITDPEKKRELINSLNNL